jgi:Major intrinsic protein
VVGILIGGAIALLGTSSGGSVNPAREFGPAIASGRLHFLSVYLLAPMLGAAIAAARLRRIHPPGQVTTYHLCGHPARPRPYSPGVPGLK